jgi:DNA polymerase III subunit beta
MPITAEVTVKPQAFAAAVAWVAKWVTSRPVTPIQGGIALEVAPDGRLHMTAFNENVTARATVDTEGLDTGSSGRAVVSGRLLADLAATFSADKPVGIATAGNGHVTLTAGRFEVTLPAFPDEDWPTQPAALPGIGQVVGDTLAAAVGRVGVANLKDESKTGVFRLMYLGFEGTRISVYATDRVRVARTFISWNTDEHALPSPRSATPFGTVLIDAAASFAGPDIVEIGLDEHMLSFTSPTRSLSMRLGDPGENGWPAGVMEQNIALADGYDGLVTLMPAEIAMPLKRASIVRGKEGPVKLGLTTGTLTIASREKELDQKGNEGTDVAYSGPPSSMAFNPRYLAEALGSVPGAEVEMHFEVAAFTRRPIVLTAKADPDWRHVIVPVVIYE